jgi:carbonic anhydrase
MMTTTTTTKPTWEDLAAANQRARQSETHEGVAPHQPEVAVLTCADARVSPARMFDLPPGALFVVRVAGASATVEAIASLTYAVEQLAVTTVVVLGHTHCGAVTAALDSNPDPALAPSSHRSTRTWAPARSRRADGPGLLSRKRPANDEPD